MDTEIHATVREQLRRTRQRYTRGREQLVDLLLDLRRPVTIPELVDQGAAQSPSSLYRNLAILEQCGVVRRLSSFNDVARYELDEDLMGHHHHVVCSVCGRIEDVELADDLERRLHAASERAGHDRGFAVSTHHLEMVGTCPDCA